MKKEEITIEILPVQGLMTIQGLSDFLELPPEVVQQIFSDYGIKVLSFSSHPKHKLVRLEDLHKKG
jgi:hypothetical protein